MACREDGGSAPWRPEKPSEGDRRGRRAAWSLRRGGVRSLLLMALAAGAAAAAVPASGSIGAQAPTVAILELGAPALTDFVLRGTLPVPARTYPRLDGLQPLAVIDSDGAIVAAQVEAVTAYPRQSDGAAVVEVLARVKRPAGASPGDRIQYQVVEFPHPGGRPALTPAVRSLLGSKNGVLLSTRDVFGNEYEIDLLEGKGSKRILRRGRAVLQTRQYGVMEPVAPQSGAQGTLPHMMGVHTYVTSISGEDVICLDLRLNNGSSGLDKNDPLDDPQAKLYFDELVVQVPAGWTVLQDLPDPFLGTPSTNGNKTVLPLVVPNNDGSMHVIGVQGQFHRRLALTLAGNEARAAAILGEAGLGFAREGSTPSGERLWSWWNPDTANYYPQRHRLPGLDHIGEGAARQKLGSDFALFSGYLASGGAQGTYPLHSGVLGWAHPWGVKYGGMTSGTEISLYDGMVVAYAASTPGYRLAQLMHRMYTDRHPVALYNKDGDPTRLAQWVITGATFSYVNMLFFLTPSPGPDPFGFNKAPTFQKDYVAQQGLQPPYESELLAHFPIDLQHLVRYTNSPKVLTWLGNDALSKDDLIQQAEISRLSYHDLPNSASGNAQVSGMLNDLQHVSAYPGTGLSFGRGEGWILDTMLCAYAIQTPAWRAEARPWFDTLTQMLRQGQSDCNGFIQSTVTSKILNGQWAARQSIEQAITEHALWGLKETVYRGVDPQKVYSIELVLKKSIHAMINYPAWVATQNGPWSHLAVGPVDPQLAPFCGYLPPGGAANGTDKSQTWSSFAYGYELTGDTTYLQRALEMAGGSSLLPAVQAFKYDRLDKMAALLALAQTVSYP
ncbi:MAG TPA: hypothetical protein VMS76_04260 [Planctomycetota bacterium]|nr:hypothetical protein [Planctomycetota bacterium]